MSQRDAGRCLIASYPKSGNTWLRFVVFHLACRRMPETSEELDALVNSDRDGMAVGGLAPFRKTHALPGAIGPLLTPGTRAIHVVRHPLDVMRSAVNYAVLTGEAPNDETEQRAWRNDWLDAYARYGGHPLWEGRPFLCGSWARNTADWYALDAIPVLRLRYEEMLRDPEGAVRAVARFLEVDLTPAELADCVRGTAFAEMRKFEEREMEMARAAGRSLGRFSKPSRLKAAEKGVRFFDKGASGSYRQALPSELASLAWSNMQPVAEALGYRYSPS